MGIISSSALSLVPAPNWISNLLLVLNLEINLLVDFFNFNKKGVCWLYWCNSGSLAPVFSTSLNIVSWAKYGTSSHVFPSLSIIDSIDIILLSNNVNVSNFLADPIGNDWVFTSPEIAWVVFFNKKYSGLLLLSYWYILVCIGSKDDEKLKLTSLFKIKHLLHKRPFQETSFLDSLH